MRPALCRSILLFVAVASMAASSHALPRYAIRVQQNCNLCHQNPTGGGMRELYATTFLIPTEMVLFPPDERERSRIQPDVSENIAIGTDVRVAFHGSDVERPIPERNFFQMQGDLYVRFQAGPRYSVYLDRGLNETRELFALAYVLPGNGYIKFGRFTPDFGWKFSDHGQFVRSGLFFQPPGQTDVGIEAGIYPGRYTLSASARNGASGLSADTDDILAYTFRASARTNLMAVHVQLGGSYWRNTERFGLRQAGGPFGAVHVGPFTWLWEFDWSQLAPRASDSTLGWVTSHEVTWALWPGVDARGVYDHEDDDVDADDEHRWRLGLGADTLLTPFFGVQAMVYGYNLGGTGSDSGYLQTELVLHALF